MVKLVLLIVLAAGPLCAAAAAIGGTDTRVFRHLTPSVLLPPCSFTTDDNTTFSLEQRDCRPTGKPLHPGKPGTQPGAHKVIVRSAAATPVGNSVPGSVVWPALDGGGQTLLSDDTGGAGCVGLQPYARLMSGRPGCF